MKPIPATPQTLLVAPRIIWFEPSERALADPIRFMTYARHEDMRVIRQYISDDDFREALDLAPPGIIDPRSWAYWNSKMGRYPAPPLPKRRLGEGDSAVVQQQPREDSEQVHRRAREDWLANRHGPGKKKT